MRQNILRMTSQREVILDVLRCCHDHPAADELYERIKRKLPRISLATVYRNLEVLSKAGLIHKLEISGRQKRFDWETRDHDHIHCIRCHRVDNIEMPQPVRVDVRPADDRGYAIHGCRVEFSGICPVCMKQQQQGDSTMGCKTQCGALTDEQRQVLQALADSEDPCGSKELASATGLESKQISCRITALKKKGYVDSPERCKYAITEEGKKALA